MGIQDSMKNALLTSGGLLPFATNVPGQYGDKQFEYFNDESKTFTQEYAKYSSDYVSARVQGLDPKDPLGWQTRLIRFADVVRPSTAHLRKADNFKQVLFADRDVQYLRPGSKIETMGSVWLVTNPFNISGSDGSGIVERCNATWNHLDFYGNVEMEPIVFTSTKVAADAPDAQEGNLILQGHYSCIMQFNDFARQIKTNSRVIIGGDAFKMTGPTNFMREFTYDPGSVRLVEFTLRFEEPNDEIDDLENQVAEGKTFDWEIFLTGAPRLSVGKSIRFTAQSNRNGETVDEKVNEVFYLWSVSDESVATVDVRGLVTGISEGAATLRCTLGQNPAIWAETEITVGAAQTGDAVAWVDEPPEVLSAYEECQIRAAFFEGGTETEKALEWSFSGGSKKAYRAVTGPRECTVYCFGYARKPLVVTASYGDSSVSAEIQLRGI